MSKYTIRSSSLTRYISKEYIEKSDTLGGAIFLGKVLRSGDRNKGYLNQLTLIIGDLKQLRRLKTSGVLTLVNEAPTKSAEHRFQMLLDSIESEQANVLIKKGELNRLAPRQFSPQRTGQKQGNRSKKKPKSIFKTQPRNWRQILRTTLIIGVLALLLFVTYSWFRDTYQDSPLSQVTSWQNPQAEEWAVYLRSYKTLKDAKLEQGSFKGLRDISIFKLDNRRYYLFVLTNSQSKAQNEFTSSVKDRWKRSRVIPFDRCTQRYYSSEGYFVCK